MKKLATGTAQNTEVLAKFLVWKIFGNIQFPQRFETPEKLCFSETFLRQVKLIYLA